VNEDDAKLFDTISDRLSLSGWHSEAEQLVEFLKRYDELKAMLEAEPKVKEFKYTDETGLEVAMEHWAVRHLVVSLYDSFDKLGGKNFATFEFELGGHTRGPMEVVIRPKWGTKTQTQIIVELKARIAELEAKVPS
jgi:hypothetical protein